VLKELNALSAKIEQLKLSFTMAWEQHIKKVLLGDPTPTKVTLEDEVEELEEDFKKMRRQQSRFAEIAVPMFEELYRTQMMAPGCRLRAFGVTHQDIAELEAAAVDDGVRYERGMFNNFMYKGIAIVQDDRAKYKQPVPIFKYGSNIADINFKPDPIGELVFDEIGLDNEQPIVEQQYCGKGEHSKICRCHLGYRIRKD
jgi:hypothetical protein